VALQLQERRKGLEAVAGERARAKTYLDSSGWQVEGDGVVPSFVRYGAG
jgi:hypothetical protein